ncbi:glycolipid transfer protein-related [Clonorchis sinensis]|uniref:Glycolipid transfer protein-related n=1 Tax=Clonorchis sinensis TaxID=79923 RepID=G7YFN1_CLOSI|nr:glycolipid transfer protein-related [Clonorchis sinensis]
MAVRDRMDATSSRSSMDTKHDRELPGKLTPFSMWNSRTLRRFRFKRVSRLHEYLGSLTPTKHDRQQGFNTLRGCLVHNQLLSKIGVTLKKVSNAVRDLNVTHLRDMLLQEQTLHLSKKDSSGSVGLLWLKRTYEFLVRTLWHLSQSTSADSMYDIIIKAYDETLTKHHNRLMRHTFKVTLHIVCRSYELAVYVETKQDWIVRKVSLNCLSVSSAFQPDLKV